MSRYEVSLEKTVPKYRKKKPSSVSKIKAKVNHKHDYSGKCILVTRRSRFGYYATYCSICWKIGDIRVFDTDENGARIWGAMWDKYGDLPKVFVDSIWQEYIPRSERPKAEE